MSLKYRLQFGIGPSPYIHFFVWLMTVGMTVGLFYYRNVRYEYVGIAQARNSQIAANVNARLEDLPVELFQTVQAGDIIAVLDPVLDNENLEAEKNVLLAEIDRLAVELKATQARTLLDNQQRQASQLQAERRLNVDVEQSLLDILKIKVQLQTDLVQMKDLELEVEISKDLLEQQAVSPYELQKAITRYEIFSTKIEESRSLLSQAEKNLSQAQHRRKELMKAESIPQAMESALNVIRAAIQVQEKQIEVLAAKRKRIILKAPFDGIVNQVHHNSGEAILSGWPIVTLFADQASEIVAYIPEAEGNTFREDMPVQLFKESDPHTVVKSRVLTLGKTIELLPRRLWQSPNREQWGRPVLFEVPEDFILFSGETVSIKQL